MTKRNPNTKRTGGPGASHENRREPKKSRPSRRKAEDIEEPDRWRAYGGGGGIKGSRQDPSRQGKHGRA
jgi:hypothetical protein